MQYEKVFFEKTKCLKKAVKKCFLKKFKYLASSYKNSSLSDKLPKMTMYI